MGNYNPTRSTIVTSSDGNSVNIPQSDLSRVIPRQLSTGSTRGVQTVGYGKARLDGPNNRILVGGDGNSSVGIGNIPGTNEFGFFLINTNGIVTMKSVNGATTWYDDTGKIVQTTTNGSTVWYDDTGVPRILTGQAPLDGRMGSWVTKTGVNVITELS